jgi:hypothetical protein
LRASRNTSLYLTKKEYSFILNIAEQSAVDGSPGVSKGAILRTLVQLLRHLEVDMSGVKTEDQLLQRLEDAVEKSRESLAISGKHNSMRA